MYAFNKRFRQVTWQGLTISTWLYVLGVIMTIIMMLNGLFTGKYPIFFMALIATIGLCFMGYKTHKNRDDHRISRILNSANLDLNRKDFFE